MDLNEVTQPDKVLKGLVRRFHSAGVGYRSLKCNGVSSLQVGDDACKYQISAEIEAADKMGVPQPYQIQELFLIHAVMGNPEKEGLFDLYLYF